MHVKYVLKSLLPGLLSFVPQKRKKPLPIYNDNWLLTSPLLSPNIDSHLYV